MLGYNMIAVKRYLALFVLYYLRFFARRALSKNRPFIIGIAGSVGKSSLRNAIDAILTNNGKTIALSGNSESGIPLSILGLDAHDYSYINWLKNIVRAPFRTSNLLGYKYLIAEMGIDDPNPPKNMDYLLTILKPDIAINLNVSATHTQQFEKAIPSYKKKTVDNLVDAIAYEDTKIITKSGCSLGIYNSNNVYIKKHIDLFKKEYPDANLKSFGDGKNDSIKLVSYEVTLRKTKFTFRLYEKTMREFTITFRDYCLPRAYTATFEAAILAARSVKIPLKVIQEGLEENFSLPKGRASIIKGIKNSTIIDSSYNASKESMLTFLELLKVLKKETKRPAVFVFGDMRELGIAAREEHEEVAHYAKECANYIYTVGPQTQEFVLPIIKGSNKRIYKDASKNSIQLGLHLKESLPQNAIILFKGSQNEIFLEEAIRFILGNQSDEKKLCRQSEYWKNRKAAYFNLN